MNTLLLLNKNAGGNKNAGADEIFPWVLKLQESGFIITEVNIAKDFSVEKVAEAPGKPDLIIAAGGDGTVSAGASIAINAQIPLGVIPLGTLNHFAKDLGIPLDPLDAVDVIINKKTLNVDAGEVNGRVFVNNSSIGLYPKAVKQRDAEVNKLGVNKFYALLKAFAGLISRFRAFRVQFNLEGETINAKATFVFIGNNAYKLDIFNLGSREKLNEGFLEIYFPNTKNRFSIFRFACLALINKLHQSDDFMIKKAKEVQISSRRRMIDISADGEIVRTKTPLRYRILEKRLRVFVP